MHAFTFVVCIVGIRSTKVIFGVNIIAVDLVDICLVKIHLFSFPNGIFVQFLCVQVCVCAPKRRYDVYYVRTNISLFSLFQVSSTNENRRANE